MILVQFCAYLVILISVPAMIVGVGGTNSAPGRYGPGLHPECALKGNMT